MSTQPIPILTAQQYLEIERAAKWKSEFLMGEMFAMAGASRNHVRISSNVAYALRRQLRGRSCEVSASDLRVAMLTLNVFVYPDVIVTCGPEQFLDSRADTLVDASVIIEILSPTTKVFDRGERFRYYRHLPSLTHYILIAQDSVRVDHHVREADGSWTVRVLDRLNDVIDLASLGCRISPADVFERVSLSEESGG